MRGNHILIKPGETLADAIHRHVSEHPELKQKPSKPKTLTVNQNEPASVAANSPELKQEAEYQVL